MANIWFRSVAASVMLLSMGVAKAGVTPDELAKLSNELTPFGAERAGNKEGTIPAWTGGLTKELVPTPAGAPLPVDQFPNEKPILIIDQKNIAQYADKVSPGEQALIAKYPDYHLTVYPTHRTFAAPQWVYDNDLKNAANGQLIDDGQSVSGVFGGTPFPIPTNGLELYWNHTLRYFPVSNSYRVDNWTGNSDGSLTMTVRAVDDRQYPYYYPDGTAATWNGIYLYNRLFDLAPAFKSGEELLVHDDIDPSSPRQAWQYLVGQRRVRRAPTVGYDTPDFESSGADYFDEVFGFWGAPDRYNWKLIGKKEMYVPYNENGYFQTPANVALIAHHLNADKVRWELHRVWVVEATLKPGQRHVQPRRTFYFDEDSYAILMADGYDASGKLWRTTHMMPLDVSYNGYTFWDATVIYNLQEDTYSAVEFFNNGWYKEVPRRPDSFFSSDALAAEGIN